jgi:DNA-binding YbaB/EbfC family protein
MFGNIGNIGKLMGMMGNMNKMMTEYKAAMARLKDLTVQGSAGGDQVTVTANGLSEIVGIKIAPDLVQAGDAGIIEEMTLAAINSALAKAKELMQQQMGQLGEILPMDQIKGLLGGLPGDLGK